MEKLFDVCGKDNFLKHIRVNALGNIEKLQGRINKFSSYFRFKSRSKHFVL